MMTGEVKVKRQYKWMPLLVALLLTPPCLLIAMVSGGVGHGDYTPAILLFPYATLYLALFERFAGYEHFAVSFVIGICLAVLQIPAYGYVISIYRWKGKTTVALICMAVLHAILAGLALAQ
jgi:hypothetical protein